MTKKKEELLMETLRCGNFTIAYDDNGSGSIYIGKHDYDKCKKKDLLIDFGGFGFCGYAPEEVEILVRALGGRVESV